MRAELALNTTHTTNLFGQVAGTRWRIDNFIVKHGEIKSQAQPDWVSRLHFGLGYIKSLLVGFLRIFNHLWEKQIHKLTFEVGKGAKSAVPMSPRNSARRKKILLWY